MMKTLSLIILLLAGIASSTARATEAVSDSILLKVLEIGAKGVITVELANAGSKPLRIWEEGNSWGDARWRVFILRGDDVHTLYQNPSRTWTRNIPAFKEIPARSHIRHVLNLDDGQWLSTGGKAPRLAARDLVIVTYDVPPSSEGMSRDVWFGVVASSRAFTE